MPKLHISVLFISVSLLCFSIPFTLGKSFFSGQFLSPIPPVPFHAVKEIDGKQRILPRVKGVLIHNKDIGTNSTETCGLSMGFSKVSWLKETHIKQFGFSKVS